MRTQPTPSPILGRQLAEWRLPMDADPTVDDAVMRMLNAVDKYLERQKEPQEQGAA